MSVPTSARLIALRAPHFGLSVLRAVVLLSLMALLTTGCGGGKDGSGPGGDNIYVTYDLKSIDGDPLPAKVNQYLDTQLDELFINEFVSGYIRLDRDDTIKAVYVQRVSVGDFGATTSIPPEGELLVGGFTREGNVLTIARDDGFTRTFTLSGKTITEVLSMPQGAPGNTVDVPLTFVYSR